MGTRITRLCGLLGLLLFCLHSAAPVAAQRDSEFMKDFRFALSKKDKQLQDKAMKKEQDQAVIAIFETGQLIGRGSSRELETEMTALAASWGRTYDTHYADSQYKYFSLMRPAVRSARSELYGRFTKLQNQYQAALTEKKGRSFAGFGNEFQAMAHEFAKLGDLYLASASAGMYADCFDEPLNGEKADLKRTCEGYGMVVEYLASLGLDFGKVYIRAKSVYDELEYQGFGDPDKGPEARKRAKAEADPSYKATPLEWQFEVAPSFSAVARPNYGADDIYPVWHSVGLKQNGTSAPINQLGDLSPKILRQGAAKVSLDSDGDGIGDTEIQVNGNLNVIECSVGEGDAKRQWAFQAITGSSRDTVQGINPFNLAADELNMSIYVAPAASMVGMIGETRIQIIDDNMDGIYGSEPLAWGLLGLRKGDNQIEVDSIVIDKSKTALPWSEQVKLGDQWYGLYPKPDGSGISYNKVDVETGTIKLDLKGLKADFMLVQGTGNSKGLCFDVASSKKGVEVPVGSYAFLSGVVSKGNRSQKMKAQVLPTSSMGLLRVGAGETVELTLGSPFSFDFDFTQNAESVTVVGSQIVVVGRGGESYQRLYNCRVQPEVSLRKEGSKKGSKGEKMQLATDQNQINDAGFGVLWAPYDETLEKSSETKMEVQLFEKKNKLFGKITSDWKGE